MSDPLKKSLRDLLEKAGDLGYTASLLGVPKRQALHDIARGLEADRLLDAIAPKLRAIVMLGEPTRAQKVRDAVDDWDRPHEFLTGEQAAALAEHVERALRS